MKTKPTNQSTLRQYHHPREDTEYIRHVPRSSNDPALRTIAYVCTLLSGLLVSVWCNFVARASAKKKMKRLEPKSHRAQNRLVA